MTPAVSITERVDIGYRVYNRIRNVGDAITPYILEHLTGFKATSVSHDVPHVLGVGSIFFMATTCSYIWGTGVLNPRSRIPPIPVGHITALRGKKTAELLRSQGLPLKNVPLGDPGIFAADLLKGSPGPKSTPKYKAAIIPHHSSIDHPFYRGLKANSEFCLVNVLDDTLKPLVQIAESDVVLSQSLHGLIFAESLGKPSVWISDQDNPDWRFKFEDWFSTTSNPQTSPLPLKTSLQEMLARTEPRGSLIDKVALRQALPIASVIHELGSPLEFRTCRKFAPITVSVPQLFSGRVYHDFQKLREDGREAGSLAYEAFSKIFRSWAERVYLCLQPENEDIPISYAQIRNICRWLDYHLTPDFAYIMTRARLPPDHKLQEIGNGVGLLTSPSLFGGALLVRPTFGGLSERSVTFVI